MVNQYSWVNIMSMIFIESPSGVGFSFSNDKNDYNTNDNKTAIDNYHFIQIINLMISISLRKVMVDIICQHWLNR